MSRFVRDFVEIRGETSLDALIATLSAIRDGLRDDADAQVQLRGDDLFGRHIAIAYQRPLTDEEAACEARYAEVGSDDLRAAA